MLKIVLVQSAKAYPIATNELRKYLYRNINGTKTACFPSGNSQSHEPPLHAQLSFIGIEVVEAKGAI